MKTLFAISAVPLHWVYKTDKIDGIVEGAQDVGFWETSQCPFYTIPCGSLSGYADQAYVVLKSLVKNKGIFVTILSLVMQKPFIGVLDLTWVFGILTFVSRINFIFS